MEIRTEPVTLGELIDAANGSEYLLEHKDKSFTVQTTIGNILELFGEERVRTAVQKATAAASYNKAYEKTEDNILNNWMMLGMFAMLFALLSVISLAMIDRDKR